MTRSQKVDINDGNTLRDLEIKLLLEAVKGKYGYEFGQYAKASMARRIQRSMESAGKDNISELVPLLLHNEVAFHSFIQDMSVVVTEMFRNPVFFKSLRENIVPILKTYPFVKIWHAGCATGQEVYSMTVLLKEEGVLDRCQIYATDFNDRVLRQARTGIYPQENLLLYEDNYQKAGGQKNLSHYCHKGYNSIKFHGELSERITFANHNLVTDGVFGEMHLILCRNVLIYFDRDLQDKVLTLLMKSLISRGVLCLGHRENAHLSCVADQLEVMERDNRIYRKKS